MVSKDVSTVVNNPALREVRRGQVYLYDPAPNIDKTNVPKIQAYGREYHDFKLYGQRPWLVVSNNERNSMKKICTLVPISASSSQYNNDDSKCHVHFKREGTPVTILAEQITTANIVELGKYLYDLNEPGFMQRVDNAVRNHLDVELPPVIDTGSGTYADILKRTVEALIDEKMAEVYKDAETKRQKEMEDCALELAAKLNDMCRSAASILGVGSGGVSDIEVEVRVPERPAKSQSEKFYDRYPDQRPVTTETKVQNATPDVLKDRVLEPMKVSEPVKLTTDLASAAASPSIFRDKKPMLSVTDKTFHSWDLANIQRLWNDYQDTENESDVMERWGFGNLTALRRAMYYTRVKAEKTFGVDVTVPRLPV